MSRPTLATVCAAVACILAGAALAVALLHGGPRGPRGFTGHVGPPGPQGETGHNAEVAHLGVCVETMTSNGVTWVDNVYPAVVSAGVPSCPSGSFTSIVPQP